MATVFASGMGIEPKLVSPESGSEFLLELLRQSALFPLGISVSLELLIVISQPTGRAGGQLLAQNLSELSGLTIGNYKGFRSTLAAKIEYHRLGGLNNIHLFS